MIGESETTFEHMGVENLQKNLKNLFRTTMRLEEVISRVGGWGRKLGGAEIPLDLIYSENTRFSGRSI